MPKKLLISISLAFICSCSSNGGNEEPQQPSSSSVAETPSSSSLAQSSSSSGVQSSSSSSGGVIVAETFTDPRDGQTYRIVTIGTQTWFAENLNYDDGNGSKGKCYENKAANCNTYGRLYDWNEAKAICPSGWRLPSKNDWNVLLDYASGTLVSAKHLKAKELWNDCGSCEDTYGFSALPGGYGGSIETGVFKDIGSSGIWWTSTETGSNHAYQIFMYDFSDRTWIEIFDGKWFMLSVRCMNGGSEHSSSSTTSSSSSKNVEYFTIKFNTDGGVPATIPDIVIAGGIGLRGAPANPTKAGYTFGGWFDGDAQYNSTTLIDKNVTLKAKWNKLGDGEKDEDLIDTRDSKSYPTVILNGKRWMAKNLNFNASSSMCYGNSPANCDTYGRLYTWDIANTACPTGWHLPTDNEWGNLIAFAGGNLAGGVLKSKGWNGNDDYNFSALPGGSYNGTAFVGIGSSGSWWTSTNTDGYKAFYTMSASSQSVTKGMDGGVGMPSEFALSVRCVED